MRRRFPHGSMALAVAAVLLVGACSSDDSSEGSNPGDSAPASSAAASDQPDQADSLPDEMRTVPTIAPSTVPGQSPEESDDGVVVVSPTLVPPPPPSVDPDQPATSVAPPTTDLIGDPQPAPATTSPPPPPTVEPPPDACERLAVFDVAPVVEAEGSAAAVVTTIDDAACRFQSGPVTAEVYFIPVAQVRDDWYLRPGIEPVGQVGGDAVGLPTFVTPTGETGAGYTIAIAGGRDGVVVAVSGTSDAQVVAVGVAILANQAA